jgi:uncharacterized protein YjiS (DUF1127 family)
MTTLNTAPRYAVPTARRGPPTFPTRLGRLFNRWVAAMIAHRERQAALAALRYLSDRDLRDIGVYRCEIDGALAEKVLARLPIRQAR